MIIKGDITIKNMRLTTIWLVCILLFVEVLGGCGKPLAVDEPIEQMQQDLDVTMLSAYRNILKAAPSIEGDYAQLGDASFGYEQNQEMFGDHYEFFALFDINQDEIPELIAMSTVNFRWTPVSVYTYADGEVVLLKDQCDLEAHGTFEQNSSANGAYITYICEKKHIHSVWKGTNPMGDPEEENHAYVIEGTSLKAVDCSIGENENTIYFYDIAKANTTENVDTMIK